MPTYDVKRDVKGDSSGSSIDDEGYITLQATLGYTILLDTGVDDTAVSVELNAYDNGLPQKGNLHPHNPSLYVVDVSVTKESVIYYTAVISYQSFPFKEDESGTPLDVPVKVGWSTIKSQEPIDSDKEGMPLRNPVTLEPINGLTRPISDVVGTFSKNILLFDPTTFYGYIDRVNSDGFYGFPPGTLRVDDIAATLAQKGTLVYFELVVKIIARKPYKTTVDKAWWLRIKSEGFYEFLPTRFDPGVVRAKDVDGHYVTAPIPIDKVTGQRIPEGEDMQFHEFEIFDTVDFASMGLLT